MKSLTPRKGVRLMLVCVLFDGSVGMIIKMLNWNPFAIAGLRSMLAAALLFAYYKSLGVRLAVNRRSVPAGMMISAMFITFVVATRLTTAANAIALQFCNPVFIILLSFLVFRQKPSPRDLLTVAGVLIGVFLIFFGSLSAEGARPRYATAGNAIAVVSGVCLAGMILFNNRAREPAEHYGALVLGHSFTFVAGIYFIVSSPPILDAASIVSILSLGILQQAIPNILYAYAIRVIKPLVCSLLMMLSLVVNPLLVFATVGERPGLTEATGCAVILAVSAAVIISDERRHKQTADK